MSKFEIISFDESGIATIDDVHMVESALEIIYGYNGVEIMDAFLMFFAINGASEAIDDAKGINCTLDERPLKLIARDFKRILANSSLSVRATCRACSERTRDLLAKYNRITRLAIELNLQSSPNAFWCFDFADRNPNCPIKGELSEHLLVALERRRRQNIQLNQTRR